MEIRVAVEAQKLAHDAMSSPDVVARYSTSSPSEQGGRAACDVPGSIRAGT